MLKKIGTVAVLFLFLFSAACATSYKAKPLPFRSPNSYPNAVAVAGNTVAAEAFAEPKKAQEAFGFDVRGAGLLPVQVVFDNVGPHTFRINPGQSFLEDDQGNLWPILDEKTAYDRTTKYAQTKQIFKGGAYTGLLGAAAGAVIGTAIGIVSGGGVGEALGKGAALGAAGGAVIGGAQGYTQADDARRTIVSDLNRKSLENKPISKGLAYGFLFFPGEAPSAKELRLQLMEEDTGKAYIVRLNLAGGSGGAQAPVPSEVVQVSPGNQKSAPPPPPAPTAPPAVMPPPPTPPPPGAENKCRAWRMVERRVESRFDPATGTYRNVPTEKWDWVEVPCSDQGPAGPQGTVNFPPPPAYDFPSPPEVAVIPGTYVYVVPNISTEILFYHGYWYRPFGGRWHWARAYNGPWVYLAPARVPRVILELPSGYHRLPPGYHRIPYRQLHANWERWERERYWHNDRDWREGVRRH